MRGLNLMAISKQHRGFVHVSCYDMSLSFRLMGIILYVSCYDTPHNSDYIYLAMVFWLRQR